MSGRQPHYAHTRAAVEIHSHDRVLRIGPGAGTGSGNITSCKLDKGFGPAAGNFSLTLKRTPGAVLFEEQFGEGEGHWLRVQWVINGRRYDRMWGLTDSIMSDVKRGEDGAEVEVITITGRDFGKVAEETTLFINIHERDGILPVAPLYTAIQERLIGRPDEIIKTLIDGWLGNDGAGDKQWVLPPSLQAGSRRFVWDWLNTQTMSENLRGKIFAPTLLAVDGMGRNLWDTMQEYANGVLNEMWFDLAPDPDLENGETRTDALRPALFMRERPFPTRVSNARWTALPAKRIAPWEVKDRHVVQDGSGRFNYWSLYAIGNGASNFSLSALVQQQSGRPPGQPGNVPIYDLDSIRKHGLRKFEQQTRYLPLDERSRLAEADAGTSGNTADFWLRVAVQWLRIIHDWYVVAPKQYTGQIVLAHIRPDIRLGDRLVETRRDGSEWEYYVEHISESYDYPGEPRMTMMVTRGQRVGTNHLPAQYARYAGLDVATLSDEDLSETDELLAPEQTADEIGTPPVEAEFDDSGALVIRASPGVTEPDPEEGRELTDADFTPDEAQPRVIQLEELTISADPGAITSDAEIAGSMEMGEVTVGPRRSALGRRGRGGGGRGAS